MYERTIFKKKGTFCMSVCVEKRSLKIAGEEKGKRREEDHE